MYTVWSFSEENEIQNFEIVSGDSRRYLCSSLVGFGVFFFWQADDLYV